MTTLERLANWNRSGIINDAQYGALSALVRRERISLYIELNALIYLGVIFLVGGLGWTFQTYSATLGDAFIIGLLSIIVAGSLYYCFSRGPGYSNEEVESPNFVFDYVLYLACLVLSVEIGYIEFRFEWLRDAWDSYLIFLTVVFFFLAYRFDNRFVLSLGLSTFAAWCGIKISNFTFFSADYMRAAALVYGSVVAGAGTLLHWQGIKKHFLEAYLHVAANVMLIALVSGVTSPNGELYLLVLLALAGVSIALGVRYRRFAFVAYGTVFGYIGISTEVIRGMSDVEPALAYVVVSGTAVIIAMVVLARRFGRPE